jgi:hypothetical protein
MARELRTSILVSSAFVQSRDESSDGRTRFERTRRALLAAIETSASKNGTFIEDIADLHLRHAIELGTTSLDQEIRHFLVSVGWNVELACADAALALTRNERSLAEKYFQGAEDNSPGASQDERSKKRREFLKGLVRNKLAAAGR